MTVKVVNSGQGARMMHSKQVDVCSRLRVPCAMAEAFATMHKHT